MESNQSREPWNKGKLIGQKPPLKTRLNARLIVRRSSDPTQQDDWNLQKW